MELSEEKTVITHIDDGFDFLGFNIRKFKGVLLTQPSKKCVKKFLDGIRYAIDSNKSCRQETLIRLLNPKITGWANYYRCGASSKTFQRVDGQIFRKVWQWAKRRHLKKGKRWIANKYVHFYKTRRWRFLVETEKNGRKDIFPLKLAFLDVYWYRAYYIYDRNSILSHRKEKTIWQEVFIKKNNTEVAVVSSDELLITDVQSALDLIMTVKYETGCTNIAVNKGAIVNDFFVLSTCLAGEILQKFISYGVRFAIYGNFSKYTSKPLRDFMFFFSGSNLSAHAAQNLSIHSMFGNGRKPVKKSLLMQRYFSP